MRKIREFVTDKDSIPRSLRVKIKLTPDMPNAVRRQKFQACEDEAKETIKLFQKTFKNHYRIVKECDRDEANDIHMKNFFSNFKSFLNAKSCYTLAKSNTQVKKTLQMMIEYSQL